MDAKDFGQLLKDHPEMLNDGKKFKAILQDIYPKEKGNTRLMVTAFDAGVVSMMQRSNLDSLLTARIITLLMDDYFISEEKARWAAELWVGAYYFSTRGTVLPKEATAHPQSAPTQQSDSMLLSPQPQPPLEPQISPLQKSVPKNDKKAEIRTSYGDKHLFIPEGVTEIGKEEYSHKNFASITIPSSVKIIGERAFAGCTSLTSVTILLTNITAPNSIITNSIRILGDGAFQGCINLTNITIPDNVWIIGWWAFEGCSSLTNITIPNSVSEIGNYAFQNCELASITIRGSITRIGSDALKSCKKLFAPAGSYAKQYAKTHHIPFQVL